MSFELEAWPTLYVGHAGRIISETKNKYRLGPTNRILMCLVLLSQKNEPINDIEYKKTYWEQDAGVIVDVVNFEVPTPYFFIGPL